MLRQVLEQKQSLRQEQIMAPHQIQSLEILMAAIPELEQKISEELLDNPTLELLDSGGEQLVGNPIEAPDAKREKARDDGDSRPDKDEVFENLLKLDELWHDRIPAPSHSRHVFSNDDEERRQYLFDSLVAEPSVQETLLDQLRQCDGLDEKTRQLCEEIVGSIDDTGYLRTHLADIATSCHTVDLKLVEKALSVIQEFEPPGIGARDLRECLLLQIDRQAGRKTLEYRIVDKHLDEIGRNHLVQVAKALNISMSELKDAMERIRKLHPYPGTLLAPTDNTDFIAPEVFVEKDENDEWQIRTNRDFVPRLRISPYYIKLLTDESTPDDVKTYIRQKVGDSKLLLRALDQREATIVRIARSLLKYQLGFFENGVEHMKPLTMSQVADDIEVHETTVSRAIANKYVCTPHGLYPFRHFFTSGYETSDGEQVSSLTVKQKLRDLINGEDKRKPWSDQRLTNMLKEQGFDVARRTVAKYREELGILPSNMRRTF